MQVNKSYKIKLYPNKEQEQKLIKILDTCRFVWNYYLSKRKEAYLSGQKSITYYECSKDLTQLKKLEEYKWISETQTTPLQQSVRTLEVAYSRFFRKVSRYPRFKSAKDTEQSFQKPKDWRIKDGKLQIEQDLIVRFRGNLPPVGVKIGTLHVKKLNDKWYASISTKEEIAVTEKNGPPIGIDLGLNDLAITSNGDKYPNIRAFKKISHKLATEQRKLSRTEKGSNRRGKQKVVVSTIHEKIKNRRINHLHQTSHRITSENQALIVCEDLSVKNMMKNRRLSKAIADVGWGEFVRQLEYKQVWRGGKFIKIDRFFPSSKTCSSCNYVVEKLPLNIREWDCPNCQAHHDRDINAAKVILQQGLRNSLHVEDRKTTRKRGKSVEA